MQWWIGPDVELVELHDEDGVTIGYIYPRFIERVRRVPDMELMLAQLANSERLDGQSEWRDKVRSLLEWREPA